MAATGLTIEEGTKDTGLQRRRLLVPSGGYQQSLGGPVHKPGLGPQVKETRDLRKNIKFREGKSRDLGVTWNMVE